MAADFNARDAAERLRDQPMTHGSRVHGEAPESYFNGAWDTRHPLNVPGPFYGSETDTCCDGPPLAPRSLLYDHTGEGFVWRQPRSDEETHALMTGAYSDPFSGYGWDGNQHWTPDLVRSWWAERETHQAMIDLIVEHVAGPRPELPTEFADLVFRCRPIGGYSEEERRFMSSIVADFVDYRRTRLEHDVRCYVYFLEAGRFPDAGAVLPAL